MTDDQTVESVRADIARIKEEIEWVERAPIPRAEAQTWISDQVDFLSAKGDRVAMAVSHAVLPNGKKFRMLVDLLSDATNAIEMDPSKRCVSIMASMFKDELKANLMTALDAHEYEAGLPQSERPKRLRELREKLLQLECGEEALIEDAEGRGIQIMRRADADPVAVLDYIADGDRGITAETRFTPRLVGMPSQDSGGAAASAGSSQSAASAAASAGHHFPISPAAVGVHSTGTPSVGKHDVGSNPFYPALPNPGLTEQI